MANLATCSGAHERQDVAPAWLADASAPGGGGAGWPGWPARQDPEPPPPPPPPPLDTRPLKRATYTVTGGAGHSGQPAGRDSVPPPPLPLTPPCALLLEPPQSSGAGKDPSEFSIGDCPDSPRPLPRWDYWVLAGDPVCPDTGAVLPRAPRTDAADAETGACPEVGAPHCMMRDCCPCGRKTTPDLAVRPRWATWCCSCCQGVGKRHAPECDEASRVSQQAPLPCATEPSHTFSSETLPILNPEPGQARHSHALRARFFGDRCECGRDLEFDPAMRPGLPTLCCKDCQGTDRRHSAECNRERSGQHLRRGSRKAALDRDQWATRGTSAWAQEENLRCPWVRWLTPPEIKKEAKSDRQRRQDGFCS